MTRSLTRVVLTLALAAVMLASAATVAGARAYTTSRPVLSRAPHMNQSFTASGSFSPKSTASNRATIKIKLWMKYGSGWGVMDVYKATVSGGTHYSRSITIPMKGDHGVQALQYRGGRLVSRSAIKYFYVQP